MTTRRPPTGGPATPTPPPKRTRERASQTTTPPSSATRVQTTQTPPPSAPPPPTIVAEDKRSWWTKLTDDKKTLVVTAIAAAVAVTFVLSIIGLATGNGPSKEEIRDQARVELYQELGLQKDPETGETIVLHDRLLATNAKYAACQLTARQAVNFELTELPLDQVLAACDTITQAEEN